MMGNRNKNVLLLGNDDRVMLAVIRSLGRQGLNVHVGWCPPESIALQSQFVHAVHDLPEYSPSNDQWIAALQSLLSLHDFELVIPCNDPAVIPLQEHRAEFEPLARIHLLDDAAYQIAFDKLATTELAIDLGIPVPTSSIVRSVADDGWRDLKMPIFVKPRTSITESDVLNKRAAERADSPDELEQVINRMGICDGLLIQEFFEGVGAGVEVLVNKGVVLCELQHIRIHETIDGGSTYRESVSPNPELSNATKKLMQAMDYTGVAMVEFRLNQSTGKWALLEINGRFWGSLPLAVASGMDFPYFLYQMLVHNKTEFPTEYRNVRCRNLITDTRWMAKQFRSSKSLNGLHVGRLLLARDHVDQWSFDDWQPLFAEVSQMISAVVRKLTGRNNNAMQH